MRIQIFDLPRIKGLKPGKVCVTLFLSLLDKNNTIQHKQNNCHIWACGFYIIYLQYTAMLPKSELCSSNTWSGGTCHLTFVLGWLGNLSFCIEIVCWEPWISQFQSIGWAQSPALGLSMRLWYLGGEYRWRIATPSHLTLETEPRHRAP